MLSRAARQVSQKAKAAPIAQLLRLQHADAAEPDVMGGPSEEFRETCRDFAARTIAPWAAEVDSSNAFPRQVDLWQEIGAFGLHGRPLVRRPIVMNGLSECPGRQPCEIAWHSAFRPSGYCPHVPSTC